MRNIDAETVALKTDDLVYLLQCGLPFSRRPFAEIGEHVGLGEQEVIAHLRSLFDSGRARRLGAVFDAWRIGYRTALCACRADEGEVDDLAARIIHHAGMTH